MSLSGRGWSAPVRRPVARAVALFALAGLLTLAAVVAVTSIVSGRVGTDSAIRDALRETDVLARTATTPTLTDGIVDDQAAAVARMGRAQGRSPVRR